ncbi:MAG: threonylcarbamoyl-AMP synthase [Clostridia bacterium]|nr:threonylcarbamoyl-AMP synthase [Clostridia bacterium]
MLEKAAELIKQGKIVVFPTETVYGIGTNGLDKQAVERLYEVKQRPLNKPISLLVSNMEMVNEIARDITDIEYKIMEKFFPGPLTIILKKKDIVPDIVTAGRDTVGVRMPSGEIAKKLVETAGTPIAAPSANISGEPSGTNIQQIKKNFGGKADFFIDGGINEIGLASTIVKVIDEKPVILRQGSITLEQINKIL